MKNLGKLAEIRGGQLSHSDPGRAPSATTTCRALQTGDLTPDGTIPWTTLRRVTPAGSWRRSAIHEGDVLVPLRSTRVTAIVARNVPERTIALGHWAIITAGPDILPDYLAWFLGHPANARQWRQAEVGSKLAFVPLAAVREMEITVPPLDVQRRIAAVDALHHRITELETQLTQARYRYVNDITRAALDGAMHDNR